MKAEEFWELKSLVHFDWLQSKKARFEAWRLTACHGKDRFSRLRAERVAAEVRKRRGNHVSAYQCRVCGEWHVGQRV